MKDYRRQNKIAWEYEAYDFWVMHEGEPGAMARRARENPTALLRRFLPYFDGLEGIRIANICGSCGKKALPMALLGADVTVFDISEANRRYALEAAEAAGVQIGYEVGDVLEIDREKYAEAFDLVFMEGGILSYFHDLKEFMEIMYGLLKKGGKMICSDFHPFNKVYDALGLEIPAMDYFSTDAFEGEMAHARFYPDEVRWQMPRCSYRKYTISDIINALIGCGFVLERFDEHPAWEKRHLPGEFTAVARKPII